jgi:hypothetical protein
MNRNMRHAAGLTGLVILLSATGCNVVNVDKGPTQTAQQDVDAGKADVVRAEIHMGAGELHMDGGGEKLMSATFRYSEKVGRPTVQYDLTDSHGHLIVESPKGGTPIGNTEDTWNLRMGSEVPLDATVSLGAGKADLDVSKLRLKSLDVQMGAGELQLNLAGRYAKDVAVQVHSGVGEARIRLPKDMGVVVDAKAGIGGVNAKGLTQRDGKYYNAAYAEGKPALRMEVHGGVGEVTLSVED